MPKQLTTDQRRLIRTAIGRLMFGSFGKISTAATFTAGEYARQLVRSPGWVKRQANPEVAVELAAQTSAKVYERIATRFDLPDEPRHDIGRLMFLFAELRSNPSISSMPAEQRVRELLPRIMWITSEWEEGPPRELVTWALKHIWHQALPLWTHLDLEVN